MEEGREAGEVINENKKLQNQERILAEYLDGLESRDFCDFQKPRKQACQEERLSSTSKARRETSRNKFVEKGQTEPKAFEKSLIARIVREPGLGLLN